MPTLSLNWKRLKHSIGKNPKTSRKDQGFTENATLICVGSSKKITKLPKNLSLHAQKKLKASSDRSNSANTPLSPSEVGTEGRVTEPANSASLILTPLQYILWQYGDDIQTCDIKKAILLAPPLLRVPRDARKLEFGKYLAIDCEFVGVESDGKKSALARASVVNYFGHVVYDKYVRPQEQVTDWRTWVSGIAPHHMNEAVSFQQAQEELAELLDGRIIVGHSLKNDLDVLLLSFPRTSIRDTSRYAPFREISKGSSPALKKLASIFLGLEIHGASHSSVEDALVTMLLFRSRRRDFEKRLGTNRQRANKKLKGNS